MAKRRVEVFTAGCYICNDAVEQIKSLACIFQTRALYSDINLFIYPKKARNECFRFPEV